MGRLIEISTVSSSNTTSSSSGSPSSSSSAPSSPYSPSRPWFNLPPYVASPERSPPHRRYPTPSNSPAAPVSPPRSPILRYQHHADIGDSPMQDFDTWSGPVGQQEEVNYGDDAAYVDLEGPRDFSVVPLTSEHLSVDDDDVTGATMSASMFNKSRGTYDKNISIETNFPELLGTMKRLQDEVRLFGLRKMQIKAFAQQELIILQRETLKIQKVDPAALERLYLPPPTGKALEELRLDIRNMDDQLDDIARCHLELIDDSYQHRMPQETEEVLLALDEQRRDLFDRLVPRHPWPLPSRIPPYVPRKGGPKAVGPSSKAGGPRPAANRAARGAPGRPPVPPRGAPPSTARPVGQQPLRPVASTARNMPPPRSTASRNMPPPRSTASRKMPPPRSTASRNMPPPRQATSRTRQGGSNMPPPRPTTSRTSNRATGASSRGSVRSEKPSKIPLYVHKPGAVARPPKVYPRPTLSLAHRLQRMEMWIDVHQREDVSGLDDPDESMFNSMLKNVEEAKKRMKGPKVDLPRRERGAVDLSPT